MLKTYALILTEVSNFTLVGTATDGRQALTAVSTLQPELVLMDISMPHMNGIEATRYLKRFRHPPTVIMVTSEDSPASAISQGSGSGRHRNKERGFKENLRAVLQGIRESQGKRDTSPGKTESPGSVTPQPGSKTRLELILKCNLRARRCSHEHRRLFFVDRKRPLV